MTTDRSLIAASAAALVERYGAPVVLVRPAEAFDPATQASAGDAVRVAVRAVIRRRDRRGDGDRQVREIEAVVPAAALEATPFPGLPMPGDRLELDGAVRAVLSVETLAVAGAPAIHVLRLGR
ncbi:MAG: hypothetical protein AB7O45_06320 [Alphaproteobacteria bacterium]